MVWGDSDSVVGSLCHPEINSPAKTLAFLSGLLTTEVAALAGATEGLWDTGDAVSERFLKWSFLRILRRH